MEVVPITRGETVLALTVKKVRRGSIVYTDRYKVYDALMFCGYRHLQVDHGKYFSRGRVYINCLEGFWNYAKERTIKHHGVYPQRFPYYLKELEFRYNHRMEDIFSWITQHLYDLVPKLRESPNFILVEIAAMSDICNSHWKNEIEICYPQQ